MNLTRKLTRWLTALNAVLLGLSSQGFAAMTAEQIDAELANTGGENS